MRKPFGFIFAIFCLAWMPTQVQASKKGMAAEIVPAGKTGKTFRNCRGCPEMVMIYSGRFNMGSPDSESGRGKDEGPVHSVGITAFAIGKSEITRSQFAEFVKNTKYKTGDRCWTLEQGDYEERNGSWRDPGYPQNDNNSVVCVNWNDAQAYAKWLSRKTGKNYRLPTEAEWEYAARGHTITARYWGGNPNEACRYANGADKTAQAHIPGATSWSAHKCTDGYAFSAPVRSFKANSFGLYDMLGNVWEWTEDNYRENYAGAPTNGSAWQGDGAKRVLRGGSWNNSPSDLRAAIRYGNKPELRFSSFGFRVVRSYK